MRLTKDFTLSEMTKSSIAERLGIDNNPTKDVVLVNLVNLCCNILQPVRDYVGRAVMVNSGYRSLELNNAIRGSKTSQHCFGEAADFESYTVSNPHLAKWISEHLEFDQLILEFYDGVDPNSGWIHCSYKNDGTNRGEVLTALKQKGGKGKVKYSKGLLGI